MEKMAETRKTDKNITKNYTRYGIIAAIVIAIAPLLMP